MLWDSGLLSLTDFVAFVAEESTCAISEDGFESWECGAVEWDVNGGAEVDRVKRWDAAAFGSEALIIADTTATPSMDLGTLEGMDGAASWCVMRARLDALTPPMQTVLTFCSASLPLSRYFKIFRIPLMPMMSFVFFFVLVA